MTCTRIAWLALALAACGGAPPRADRPLALAEAGDALRARCGPCHVGGAPDAVESALAAFDVSRTDWSEGVSDARLREAVRRMDRGRDPSGRDLGVTERDRTVLRAFVDAEIEARGVRSPR